LALLEVSFRFVQSLGDVRHGPTFLRTLSDGTELRLKYGHFNAICARPGPPTVNFGAMASAMRKNWQSEPAAFITLQHVPTMGSRTRAGFARRGGTGTRVETGAQRPPDGHGGGRWFHRHRTAAGFGRRHSSGRAGRGGDLCDQRADLLDRGHGTGRDVQRPPGRGLVRRVCRALLERLGRLHCTLRLLVLGSDRHRIRSSGCGDVYAYMVPERAGRLLDGGVRRFPGGHQLIFGGPLRDIWILVCPDQSRHYLCIHTGRRGAAVWRQGPSPIFGCWWFRT